MLDKTGNTKSNVARAQRMKGEWSGMRSENSEGEQMKRILKMLECLKECHISSKWCVKPLVNTKPITDII